MSALEAMMNRTLNRQGITARTSLKDGRLKVLLEAEQNLEPKKLTAFIAKGITKLSLPSVQVLQVYGKRMGQESPDWQQVLTLSDSKNSALKVSAKANETAGFTPTAASVKTNVKAASSQSAMAPQMIAQPAAEDDRSTAAAHPASSDSLETIQQAIASVVGDDVEVELSAEDSLLVITLTTKKVLDGQSLAKNIKLAIDELQLQSLTAAKLLKRNPRTLRSFPIKEIMLGELPPPLPEPVQVSPEPTAPTPSSTHSQPVSSQRMMPSQQRTVAQSSKSEIGKATDFRRKLTVILVLIVMGFILFRLIGRLLLIAAASPMLGGFSILLVLFSLWRFHRLFNPLLQILLQHDKQ